MIVKGKLIKCKREVKEFKKGNPKEKLYVTLAEAEVSEDQFEKLKEAFKDSGKQFTPEWILNFEGYVNLSTEFQLPCRTVDKEEFDSIEDCIKNGLKWMGAEVKISINVKEGAIYPSAIVFLTEGSALNAFAEFDEEE